MSTVDRGAGFPVAAVALGLVGTGLLILGLLGYFEPEFGRMAPSLARPAVSGALVLGGIVALALEGVMLVAWARRRAAAAGSGNRT